MLTIILVSAIVYLGIAYVFCFIATSRTLLDSEDLMYSLIWIIIVPLAFIRLFIYKYKKHIDKI